MKRKVSFILCIVMVLAMCTLCAFVSFAEDAKAETKLSVESGKVGDTITMTVSLSGAEKAKSMMVTAVYDPAVLKLVGGEWLVSGFLSDFKADKNAGVVAFQKATDVNEDVFIFTFEIIGSTDEKGTTVASNVTVKGASETVLTSEPIAFVANCNHTYTEWVNDGVEGHKRECTICNRIETAEHDWDSGFLVKSATCKEEGLKTYECTVCGEVKEEVIPVSKRHVYGKWTKDETNSQAHKHECTICGNVETAAHNWDNGTVTTQPTCTETGIKTYTCKDCGAEITGFSVPATGHKEVTDAAVAPTCTAAGKTEGKHCSVCGEVTVAQKEVPAKGHTEATLAAVAPTCTAAGKTEGKHCSVCKTVLVAQKDVPATGHTEVVDAAVAATCTTAGKTEGKHCSVCNEVIVAQKEVPATGHTYGEWLKDETNHWQECACGEKGNTAEHAYGEDNVCDVCSHEKPADHEKPNDKEEEGLSCNSSIASYAVLMTSVLGLGVGLIRKKKEQ